MYIGPNDDISQNGNIFELEGSKYTSLLKYGSVDFKRSDLQEKDSLISRYALVYKRDDNDEVLFPDEFTDPKVIKEFLATTLLCTNESGVLKLLHNINLLDLLPALKSKMKKLPTLSEHLQSPPNIDKRLPEYLSDERNFMGRICCGCGFSDGELTCHDLECYSDYAWIADGICYIYFGGSMSGISFVNLFPFKLA